MPAEDRKQTGELHNVSKWEKEEDIAGNGLAGCGGGKSAAGWPAQNVGLPGFGVHPGFVQRGMGESVAACRFRRFIVVTVPVNAVAASRLSLGKSFSNPMLTHGATCYRRFAAVQDWADSPVGVVR